MIPRKNFDWLIESNEDNVVWHASLPPFLRLPLGISEILLNLCHCASIPPRNYGRLLKINLFGLCLLCYSLEFTWHRNHPKFKVVIKKLFPEKVDIIWYLQIDTQKLELIYHELSSSRLKRQRLFFWQMQYWWFQFQKWNNTCWKSRQFSIFCRFLN